MIDSDLAAFMQGPVMMVFGARSAAGLPAVGRAVGARPAADRSVVDIFVAKDQWAEALSGLGVGSPLALTASQPSDYRTFQLKGEITRIGPAAAEDLHLVDGYVATASEALRSLGIPQSNIDQWLHRPPLDGLITLRLKPVAVFLQTPGPEAGAALPLGGP